MYLENYKIPFIITGINKENIKIDKICTSKDIPATLCELAFGEVPKEFTGKSIFRDWKYPNIHIEYCGGGCPDLLRRELKIAAFDDRFFVGTLCTLENDINIETITEVYNLKDDPKQLRNLVKSGYSLTQINSLVEFIQQRKKEILASIPEYQRNLKK